MAQPRRKEYVAPPPRPAAPPPPAAPRGEVPHPSKAAIFGHPIHPMLVPFPLVLLVGAFGTDLAFLGTQDPFWAEAGQWMIGAGVVTGLIAGAVGAVDFASIRRARQLPHGWIHAVGNVLALVLAAINFGFRLGDEVLSWGLPLSIATVLILAVTAWLGGEMSFRYLIGASPRRPEKRPEELSG